MKELRDVRSVLAGIALLALPLVTASASPILDDTTPGLENITLGAGTYTITATGASGGSDYYGNKGGVGAVVTGSFTLIGSEMLSILVGGAGLDDPNNGGGGGGGSFVVGPNNVPLLIAGGGGGGGEVFDYIADTETPSPGGAGGPVAASGGAGGVAGAGGTSGGAGGGGLTGDGGSLCCFYSRGPGGSFIPYSIQGGLSFIDSVAAGNASVGAGFAGGGQGGSGQYGGGGGGGGYTGGNAGAGAGANHSVGGGGLGGTSFDAGRDPLFALAQSFGNGSVIITEMAPVTTVPEPASLALLGGALLGLTLLQFRRQAG